MMIPVQLAQVNPNDVAPMIISLAFAVVAIIIVLVRHQQKMALILRGLDPTELRSANARSLAQQLRANQAAQAQQLPDANQRLEALESQVQGLKDLMQQQTILLDNVLNNPSKVEELRSRLGG